MPPKQIHIQGGRIAKTSINTRSSTRGGASSSRADASNAKAHVSSSNYANSDSSMEASPPPSPARLRPRISSSARSIPPPTSSSIHLHILAPPPPTSLYDNVKNNPRRKASRTGAASITSSSSQGATTVAHPDPSSVLNVYGPGVVQVGERRDATTSPLPSSSNQVNPGEQQASSSTRIPGPNLPRMMPTNPPVRQVDAWHNFLPPHIPPPMTIPPPPHSSSTNQNNSAIPIRFHDPHQMPRFDANYIGGAAPSYLPQHMPPPTTSAPAPAGSFPLSRRFDTPFIAGPEATTSVLAQLAQQSSTSAAASPFHHGFDFGYDGSGAHVFQLGGQPPTTTAASSTSARPPVSVQLLTRLSQLNNTRVAVSQFHQGFDAVHNAAGPSSSSRPQDPVQLLTRLSQLNNTGVAAYSAAGPSSSSAYRLGPFPFATLPFPYPMRAPPPPPRAPPHMTHLQIRVNNIFAWTAEEEKPTTAYGICVICRDDNVKKPMACFLCLKMAGCYDCLTINYNAERTDPVRGQPRCPRCFQAWRGGFGTNVVKATDLPLLTDIE